MILGIDTPAPETVEAWFGVLENKPVIIAALLSGMALGMVVMLIAMRKGWLSNAQQVESAKTIARLEEHVANLETKMEGLLNELKPWRKFQEKRMEEFFYKEHNDQKT